MTKSNLWLYTEAPIDEDTPAWIEDLSGDHSPLGSAFPIPNFIPFDPALDVTIRIDMDGYSYIKDKKYQVFNYCSVTYDDSDKVWYYFVRSAKWRANNTLALVLHMDVINTLLKTDDLSTCMEARTMILRQHENRFSSIGFTGMLNTLDYLIKVDDIGEGLGSVVLRKTSSEKITDDYFNDETLKSTPWTLCFGKTGDKSTVFNAFINPVNGSMRAETIDPTSEDPGTPVIETISNSDKLIYTYEGTTKIIEVPYFPYIEPSYDTIKNTYSFGDDFLGIKPPIQSFIELNGSSIACLFKTLTNKYSGNARKIALKNDIYVNQPYAILPSTYLQTGRTIKDTKLLHSDFYCVRYVYDTFSFTPSFERMTATSNELGYAIFYAVTAEPVSTFAFKFSPLGFSYKEASDYEQWLIVSRNNERMLFTDSYINYLRNGYNYDMKTKALNAVNSLVIKPALGSLTSLINPVFGVVGSVSTLTSGIIGTLESEVSMEKKLAEEQAKSVTTAGSDNLTIMRAVTGNKLWRFTYEPSERIKTMLDDLFYYYGYKRGYQGIPNATSRKWFNFVQCEAKWKPSFARSSKPFLDELTQKFRNGVTFFHYNEVANTPSWMEKQGYDLQQKSENWETIITGV